MAAGIFDFHGPATPMSDHAIEEAARAIGCDVAAIRAVIRVESRGGFLADGRPKILFERHYFARLTGHRYDRGHPRISGPQGGYQGGAAEYDRLAEAMTLDANAALSSASWGAFQIMGANFQSAGFPDVHAYVVAMCQSEDNQLKAFVDFVNVNKLDDELRRRDWEGFARGYNGPNFRQNNYDHKLAAAYLLFADGAPRAEPARRTLSMGAFGEDVAALQAKLHPPADGDFGPDTRDAVIAFQEAHGLPADGVVGQQTWHALDNAS